jgi:hypothetical protein
MSEGLKVVSSARKLIMVVPQTDRKVSFPQGATISGYGKGNDNPVIVVQNITDGGSWQGAQSGQYVIVNEVQEEAAHAALDILGGEDYTIDRLDAALTHLANAGFRDQYTTDQDFVSKQLSPAGKMLGTNAGIVKRDSRDVCTVYRDSEGVLQIVIKEPRRIEPNILVRTYRNVDGTTIDLDSIPTVS